MYKLNKKYYLNTLSRYMISTLLIFLFFVPTINELYEVYAHSHSLHCTAEHENHLHKDHETFLYNNIVINDFVFANNLEIRLNIISLFINQSIYKENINIDKRLVLFFSRPPPFN